MDVDDDGQRIVDRIQHNDIMDTTLDYPPQPSTNAANPEALHKTQVATEAPPTSVPEGSLTKEDEGVQPPSKQMRKTPH